MYKRIFACKFCYLRYALFAEIFTVENFYYTGSFRTGKLEIILWSPFVAFDSEIAFWIHNSNLTTFRGKQIILRRSNSLNDIFATIDFKNQLICSCHVSWKITLHSSIFTFGLELLIGEDIRSWTSSIFHSPYVTYIS